ncbi:MAG: Ig-like domain-containing protein, partial [Cyclobacteriaceae bacterium]
QLTSNTAYTVDWDAGAVTDSDGNDLAVIGSQSVPADGTWNFTTETDVAAPAIVALSPANDETGVPSDVNLNLVIEFDEPVDIGSGILELFYNDGVTSVPSQAYNVTSFVLSNSDRTATLPITGLDGNTEYYVSLPASAFADEAVPSNNIAAIDPDGSWSFVTATDASAPTVNTLNPTNLATNVDLLSDLTITFSERVFAGTGTVTLTSTSQVITINVADGTQISGFGTNMLTVDPSVEFFGGESYTVSIDANAITDASGNSFNAGALAWSFTTETGVTVAASTADLCEGSGYITLNDNIVISENAVDNFAVGNAQTYIISLPSGFEFNSAEGNVSGASGDITATNLSVTSSSLTLTYSIGSLSNNDVLTISNLQIRYTGSDVLTAVEVFRGGTADQAGNQPFQEQPNLILNTNSAPSAPSIEETAAPGTFINQVAFDRAGTSSFSIQVNGSVGGSTYSWENVETNNSFVGTVATDTDLNSNADFDTTIDNLYSFDVTETDANGCTSPATRVNILTYDLTLTPNVTTFSVDDNNGTSITISKPRGHVASFSGAGIGNISVQDSSSSANATAKFIPSTAGSAGSPHQITYTITNERTSESFDLTEGLNFTVNPLVTIFANSVPVDYCFTSDDTNSDIDLDTSITPNNFYFYRIELFDEDDNPIPAAITAPAGWANSGITPRISGVPPAFSIFLEAKNHFTSVNWTLDPSAVSEAGVYTLGYYIVKDGTEQADLSTNEILFRTQEIEIFELPDVEFTSFTNTEDRYCEDEGLIEITATLNGSTVTVDGYTITGFSGPVGSNTANIASADFNPANPLNDGNSYASSRFTISYTSDPADEVNGCVNTVEEIVANLATPPVPALTAGVSSGISTLYEFCEFEVIPDFEIAGPVATAEYEWQDANGTIPTFNELATGPVASAVNLFGTFTPDPGVYEFVVKRIDFEAIKTGGCESDLREITVIIYEEPFLPELDLVASISGVEVDFGVVEYNYCAGDTYEDFVLVNTLSDPSQDSTFVWLNADKDVIPGASIADPLNSIVTPEELGLDVVDLSTTFDTTYYVIAREFRNTPQFLGCGSDTLVINLTIHANPSAPALGDTGFDFFTEYYACEGDLLVTGNGIDALDALLTPQEDDIIYRWYEDSDGTGTVPGAFLVDGSEISLSALEMPSVSERLDLNTDGVYYFWLTKVSANDPIEFFDGCEGPATRISVIVYPEAVAPIPNSQGIVGTDYAYAFCEGDIATTTEFTVSQVFNPFMGATGLSRRFNWYQSNASGAISNPTRITTADASGSVATAVDLGLVGATAQTRYFLVTHVENIRDDNTFNGCESAGSLIRIDIQDNPVKPTVTGGNTFEYCINDAVADITVTGEGNPGEVFIWYENGVEVHRGATATATDLGVSTVFATTIVDDSVYVFTVTQTQDTDFNGFTFAGCESPAETITIIVHPTPVKPVVSVAGNLSICPGEGLPTLSVGNQQTGATVSWRNALGTEISTASNFDPGISNTTPGSTTFSVIQIVDNCPSEPTDVTITVNPTPAVPVLVGNGTANSYVLCAESDVSSVTLDISSPNAGSTYNWYAGSGRTSFLFSGESIDFTDLDINSASLNINNAGTTNFFVTETSAASCESNEQLVTVTINPLPNLSINNIASEYCFDDGDFTITGFNNGAIPSNPTNGSFSINTGGLIDNGDGTATINPANAALAAGETRNGDISVHTITYSYTDVNACANSIDVDFTINPQ